MEAIIKVTAEKTYQSDLTYEQLHLLTSILEKIKPEKGGAPIRWPLLTIFNAIMYVIKSGCQWCMVPSEFPPWQTVCYHYNKWCKSGVWRAINDTMWPTANAKRRDY